MRQAIYEVKFSEPSANFRKATTHIYFTVASSKKEAMENIETTYAAVSAIERKDLENEVKYGNQPNGHAVMLETENKFRAVEGKRAYSSYSLETEEFQF